MLKLLIESKILILSCSVAVRQAEISANVRQQPSQNPVSASMIQWLMQGDWVVFCWITGHSYINTSHGNLVLIQ